MGQTPGSLPALKKNPPGFENAIDGTIGGGAHNYFRCTQLQIFSFQDVDSEAKATEAHLKLAARVSACLTPEGWTASEPERTRKYEDYETVVSLTHPRLRNDVVVELITDNSSPSTRRVSLRVRNPNPKHVAPQ